MKNLLESKYISISILILTGILFLSFKSSIAEVQSLSLFQAIDFNETKQHTLNSTPDSLPAGVTKDWLNLLQDESGNKIYKNENYKRGPEEPGSDALQQKFFDGQATGEYCGNSISDAGDINGDGYGDIIIGAHGYNSYTGRAYIYFGGQIMSTTPDLTLTAEAASNFFGFSVSKAGDINLDGFSDVIVGAFGYNSFTGRAYIYYGGALMNNVADVTLTGAAVNINFGSSVSTAGDVNNDGYSDVIIGSEIYSSSTGRAYIYFGGAAMNNTVDVTMTGTAAFNYFGISVSDAGDVNGDGYSDVIVGANGYNSNTGRAYIFYGGAAMNNGADIILTGQAVDNYFGTSVSTSGDINRDGYSDVIAGASGYNTSTGRAYIFYGGALMNNAADVIFTGETTATAFGYSVSEAGDINGDSYDDIIVGAYTHTSFTGKSYIYFGGAPMNNGADVILNGESTFNRFGASVSTAGDINGDSYPDVIVGAWGYNSSIGRVYAFTNTMTGEDIPDVIATGEAANDNFGGSVSGAGDVNGDGYGDVIVGAYKYNSLTGRAYIYYGGPSTDNYPDVIITGETTNNNFGVSVSGAGDVNGDGYDDVIAGAYEYNSATGRAYIYYGGPAMNNVADVTMTGETTNNNFGIAVSGAGDVNADGYSDVIVGADLYGASTGRAYVYYGGAIMNNVADVTMTGEAPDNTFGKMSVSGAGDVNGDGYSEVIVGASGYSTLKGRAYLFYGGAAMNNTADVIITGEAIGDNCGYSVSGAEDLNGDGYSDVIVGLPGYNSEAGRVYIYFGSAVMNNVADVIMNGEANDDNFGFSVSDAGDVNSDGYPDVIIGAQRNNSSRGKAYIYFGGNVMNSTADIFMKGEGAGNYFGLTVSGAGDINNDGSSDLIVGASGYNSNTGRAYIFQSSPPARDPYGYITIAMIMEGYYNNISNDMRLSDTARIYLRNSISPYLVVDSSKGIINKNTLSGTFTISNASSGNYYIAIKHRNCIETWSRIPVSYTTGDSTSYTFITSGIQAFGSNMKQVDNAPVRFAIYSGDVNQDGAIELGDLSMIDNNAYNFISGYVRTDLNGDNFTDLADYTIADNNAFNFVSKVTP
ncbi:MAG: integrin alpha [Bacteroidota bacterium]|nr:integrin alpha [Bacteroidota bacterium]